MLIIVYTVHQLDLKDKIKHRYNYTDSTLIGQLTVN